jgi:hypothetical protein
MSLGLLVTESALHVQPESEENCKEVIIRQDQPDSETKRKAYLWCKDFLHGAWRSVSEDDFEITIIRYAYLFAQNNLNNVHHCCRRFTIIIICFGCLVMYVFNYLFIYVIGLQISLSFRYTP